MRNILGLFSQFQGYITAGLGALLLLTSVGWYVTGERLDSARHELKEEKQARKADREIYKRAQAEAESKALREKAAIEERNRERAKEADANYGTLLAQYHAALLRKQAAASGSAPGGPNLPGTPGAAEGGDGPSQGAVVPEVIPILFSDAEICAENTARLQVIQKWLTENK